MNEHAMVVHCKRARYDVYVGRGRCPNTGKPGSWGNPFTHLPEVGRRHGMTLVA